MAGTGNDEGRRKSTRKNLKFLVPAPEDAPPELKKAYSRYITVEPVSLCLIIAFGVIVVVLPQYLRERIAEDRGVRLPNQNRANGTCNVNRSHPYYISVQEIQAEVARWQLIAEVCGRFPAIFIAPLLGAWSDIVGRKRPLIIAVSGFNIYAVGFLLVYYFKLPIVIIPLCNFVTGICGGFGFLNSQFFAYISDITSKENRLIRIALVAATQTFTIGICQVVMGYLIRDYGFAPAIWILVVMMFLATLYLLIPQCLLETVDTSQTQSKSVGESIKAGWKDLKSLFKINLNLRRRRLGLLYSIDFFREILETSYPIVILYGLGIPFCWSPVAVSYYLLITTILGATAMFVAAKGFSLCLPDLWNLQISMLFNIAYGFGHALARTTVGLYLAGAIGCFRNISQPLVPAMLAKMVSEHEHGAVFAFDASIQNLGSLISPVLLNSIYRGSAATQPNRVFYAIGVIAIIPFILTAILQWVTRKSKQMEEEGQAAPEKTGIENPAVDVADEKAFSNI